MRILFVGAVEFSRHCLQEVLGCGGNVVAVFTLADKDAAFHADYAHLSDTAGLHAVRTYEIDNINAPQTVELIRSLRPDVILVFGWSQIVSKEILRIPPLGCIGTHPALLPLNRGRHPIVWALVDGLTDSGLTFFYLDEKADSGDILWQKAFPITLEDDAGSVYRKIEALASEAIRKLLPQLESGTAPRTPQDHTRATYRRKRTEEDGEIDWSTPSMGIHNLIRALTRPYVGAHTYIDGTRVFIWQARLPAGPGPQEALSLGPGTIFNRTEAGIDVRTGDGNLLIAEYESENSVPLVVGARLGGLA